MDFDDGMREFKAGNYEEAAHYFLAVTQEDNQNHKAWNALGICLSKTGEFVGSETCFSNAVSLSPNNEIYQKNLKRSKNNSRIEEKEPKISTQTFSTNVKNQTENLGYQRNYWQIPLFFLPFIGLIINPIFGILVLLACSCYIKYDAESQNAGSNLNGSIWGRLKGWEWGLLLFFFWILMPLYSLKRQQVYSDNIGCAQKTTKSKPVSIFSGFGNFFGVAEVRAENQKLKTFIQEIGAENALIVKENIKNLTIEENEAIKRKNRIIQEIKDLDIRYQINQSQLLSVDEQLMLEDFALYKPHFAFENSSEYKQKLDIIREDQKALIKSGSAARGNIEWSVGGSKSEGKKLVNDTIKLLLRSFNNECDYCVDHVKFNNIDLFEKRITKSFETLNKLGTRMNITISSKYKDLKIEELYLSHEYQIKKQEEKEEQRRRKEDERESQKLEREIREVRDKIEKERKHYTKAIFDTNQRLALATDPAEIYDLKLKLDELHTGFVELDKEEKEIDYREQNAKAGYVYVISNVGAFGENIFKIGMTRRLDPMDRIIELGDASVPFPFDIHALIFSKNAPDLEAKIQNHFHSSRLNKVNPKREFFRANVDEIEEVLKNNFEKTLDFTKIPPAEQYRESLRISE